MFAWAPIPEAYRELGSIEFAKLHRQARADVAVSPGVGFGPGGDGFVRFALIENEQRIAQAVPQPEAGPDEAGLAGELRASVLRPQNHTKGDKAAGRRA